MSISSTGGRGRDPGPQQTPVYDIDGARRRLGDCARATLYRLDAAGEITLFKVLGKTLAAGVDELIDRQIEAARQAKLQQALLAQETGASAPIAARDILEEQPQPDAVSVRGHPEIKGRHYGRRRKSATGPPSHAEALSDGAT